MNKSKLPMKIKIFIDTNGDITITTLNKKLLKVAKSLVIDNKTTRKLIKN